MFITTASSRAAASLTSGLVGGGEDCGLLAVDSAPPFAGNCGGHCQVMKRCGELVKEKGLKGAAYQSEFNKCMTDAANYK